ncbi:hypothetical protein D3C72_1522650 [compost metagenome]
MGCRGLRNPERCLDVASRQPVVRFVAHVGHAAVRGVGRAMHHDVQAAERCAPLLEHRLNRRPVGHIAPDENRLAAFRHDLRDHGAAVALGAGRHDHARPFARQLQRNRLAHATATAGNQRAFPFESPSHVRSCVMPVVGLNRLTALMFCKRLPYN